MTNRPGLHKGTPLAQFITNRLVELGMKQVDFCRQTGFDQGLLSKLQGSVISTINLESALRLADGLDIPAGKILSMLDRDDAHQLLQRLYGNRVCARCGDGQVTSDQVQWIIDATKELGELGRDMSPLIALLRHMTATRRLPSNGDHSIVAGY